MVSVAPKTTCVDLLENESNQFMYLDGVTSITFFDGPAPVEQIKDGLVKVVQASPWLAGKLVKSKEQGKKGKPVMAFHDSPSPEAILEKLFVLDATLDITATTTSGEDLVEKVKKSGAHLTDTGWAHLKKGNPYTKMTVCTKHSGASSPSWVLIFSISHALADGYTYYKILNMLPGNAEVTATNPVRKQEFVGKLKNAVGEKVYNTYMGATPLMMNFVGNMCCGAKPRVRTFYVDPEKVNIQKQREKQRSLAEGAAGEFVSTNDIITNFWGKLTRARLVEMAVNFRGRMPELKADDAGNYEGCILFSDADMEAGPSSVRKALQRKDGKFQSAAEKPLPGFCEMRSCRYRICSNWASFFTELQYDGCSQALHIPYLAPSAMPTDIMIIFKPTKDTFGVYIVTRKLKDSAFEAEDSILGKGVLPPA